MAEYKTIQANKGKYAYPLNESLNVRSGPGTSYGILENYKKGNKAGLLTSEYYFPDSPEKAWVKIALFSGSHTSGWVRTDVIKIVPRVGTSVTITNPTKKDAQKITDKLVRSDQLVASQLGVVAEMLGRCQISGISIDSQLSVYQNILDQYNARQEFLRNSTLLKVESDAKDTLAWMKQKAFQAWTYLKLSGLGELTTATIIGITVGVTLALSAAAYIIVKPKYDESQVNLKLLGETKKWIESLPPEVQTKVKADLEKQLDDAFNKGKTDGFFGGAMKILKPLAIGVISLVAFPRIIGAWGKNNQKAVA